MGQAAVRPAREAAIRRALAWALAIAANGALVSLVLFLPRAPVAPAALEAIDLILVTLPETRIEPVETPPEPAPDLPPAPREPALPERVDDDAEVSASSPDEEEENEAANDASRGRTSTDGLPDYGVTALPESAALTGTPFVIREIFCLTSSEATRDAGHCPDDPDPDGLSMLRYASDANIEAGMRAAAESGLSADEIRAMFAGTGLPLADLSGQPSLADASQRPTSSSDEMRDSLPPRHPDPVFGD